MTILIITLVLLLAILSAALYFQVKQTNRNSDEQQQLLKDYQRRVDEQEKLLSDYRALEQNFDNVGQGYEQALLAFDKIEEEKQNMQKAMDTLQQQNNDMQENYQKLSGSLLQKKEIIEKAANEAKRQIVANPNVAQRLLNGILNANDINMETALEADDNVTIGEIVDKAVLESGISKTGYLSFSVEADEALRSMMILTNEAALTRALCALLDNAGKFTTEGGVRLIVKNEASKILFTVEDTGSGIAAEDAEKVFEPFTRLNSFFEGDGIGLTAARSIARRLNGDIVLDPAYTDGARFILSIPD